MHKALTPALRMTIEFKLRQIQSKPRLFDLKGLG
jgi:hypothetical protein